MIKEKEIMVKSALSPSHLPGIDYALNPYRGCSHACIYCYAPYVIHWDKGKWGELVEVKINLPRILSKEIKVLKKGVVGLGTVTDPYQPAEKKYELTRRCLELLLLHDIPVCIQTKSSLVLRDMDLLNEFSHAEIGITLTSLDENIGKRLEPGAPGADERLDTLQKLSKNGIRTWVFFGPVMPYLIDIDEMADAIASVKPAYVLVDRLRLRVGIMENIHEFIRVFDPDLISDYENIFSGSRDYYGEIFREIVGKFREKGVKCDINRL